MKLHEWIDQRRERAGLSVADFARRCTIKHQNLGPMLRGLKPIRLGSLILILASLGAGEELDLGKLETPANE